MKTQTQSNKSVIGSLGDELGKEREKATKLQLDTDTTKKKWRELQQQQKDAESRMMRMFSTRISPEEVIGRRRLDRAQQRDTMELHARCSTKLPATMMADNLPPIDADVLGKFWDQVDKKTKERAHEDDTFQVQKLKSIAGDLSDEMKRVSRKLDILKTDWLKQQASTDIVNVGETTQRDHQHQLREQAESAKLRTGTVANNVLQLQQKAGNCDFKEGAKQASVGFSRYLRASDRAHRHQGPSLKVSVPMPAAETAKGAKGGVLTMYSDLEHMGLLHNAVL